jgi:hypothetical protein
MPLKQAAHGWLLAFFFVFEVVEKKLIFCLEQL